MTYFNSFIEKTGRIIKSDAFYWVILTFFILEALWIALSGVYPMAFDEDFHLGIIKIYSQHISPFWGAVPAGSEHYGAIARDPSYLYHYLMSFPYRFVAIFTNNLTSQVIILRFINIALFSSGLILFRKVLLKTRASKGLVNASYAVFVLIPIMPLLAAQINYDNMILPLTAITLSLTIRLVEELKLKSKIDAYMLLLLLITCLAASLVKYAFLPIFAAIIIYLFVIVRKEFKKSKQLHFELFSEYKNLSSIKKWTTIIIGILLIVLFSQRYLVNTVKYHTPIPDCSKVLDVEACSDYGPWIRDYNFTQDKQHDTKNPIAFAYEWFYGMWFRLFFAVDGPASNFQTKGPLLLPAMAGIIFPVVGVILIFKYRKRIIHRYENYVIWLFVSVITSYISILWLDEFRAYIRTGHPVAINGRYLLPILLPILIIFGMAYIEGLKQLTYKIGLLFVLLLCLIFGGGTLTYILRSNDNWLWPNYTVRMVNSDVRNVLGPITPGYYNESQFMR